jgi:hypothetical protein
MPQKPKNPGSYKQRAKDVRERLKEHPSPGERTKLLKKQKALDDMGSNEDWLRGKPGSQLK